MLLGFKLRNFRSFAEEQFFACTASDGAGPERLRLSAVFGPNGSGKTNLILGLTALRDLVLNSATCSEDQYAVHYCPFQPGPVADHPVEFEVLLELDGQRYRYSLAYNAYRVLHERLLVYVTGKPQRWFERRYDRERQEPAWQPFSPNLNGSRELWRRMTGPKSLFLSTAVLPGCEQLKPITQWFEVGLGVRLAD